MRKTRTVLVGTCLAAAVVAGPALADTSSTIVEVSTASGSRTLNLKSLTGDALSSSSVIKSAPGRDGTFVAAVTDANYAHVGYQVSATMTDLYKYDSNALDRSKKIDSANVRLNFGPNPLDLANVNTLIQPVLTLTGDATNILTGTWSSLGLPAPTTNNVTYTITGLPQNVLADATHILDGAKAGLPFLVTPGTGGAFTNPASLNTDNTVNESGATSLKVMSGNGDSVNITPLLDSLKAALNGKTVAALINEGVIDGNALTAEVARVLGVPASVIDQTKLVASLTAQINDLTGSIIGQNGVYGSAQAIGVNIPASAPSGTYRGVLTVTLADVP